jgi:hypothetical protein
MVQNYLSNVEPPAQALARKRSFVVVVGYDLRVVVETARTIRETGLAHATMEEIADAAGISDPSKRNTFFTKVYNTAKYKLIDLRDNRRTERKEVVLLPLGEVVLDPDPQKAQRALVEAFLNVPVHRELWIRFDGKILPDDAEFNRVLDEIGVSSGQLDTVRQEFKRSAGAAGFFKQGKDRLIMPEGVDVVPDNHVDDGRDSALSTQGATENERTQGQGLRAEPDLSPAVHRFLTDMWADLSENNAGWSVEAREEWLDLFTRSFRYIYLKQTR